MTNNEIFYHIEKRNSQPVLSYFYSFSEQFYFYYKKNNSTKKFTTNQLTKNQLETLYVDTCVLMYEKIEAKKITPLDMSCSIKTLLFGIAKKKILEHFRAQDKYNSLHLCLEDHLKEISTKKVEEKDTEITELEMQQLEEGILALSPKNHFLIVEGFMENKSYSEIAKEQDYPSANAVTVAMHRAIKILKEIVVGIKKRDGNY